ncbi:MAG TPA: NUDIX domain-containing protein [Candidatus Saccharimonadales bacterium]|nr:NUDIX domain-containing protein [Candidatus Saccharimonadales bacterium]
MASPTTVQIAIAILRQGNLYLLQQRSGEAEIGAAGLAGWFGGKIDGAEGALRAIVREIGEETNLLLAPESFRYMGTVEVDSDMKLQPVRIVAQVFAADVPSGKTVLAKEGALVAMTREEMHANLHTLTPATRAAIERLMR